MWCLSFVSVAEMTQWARLRDWAPRNYGALTEWMSGRVFLDATWETARTWGNKLVHVAGEWDPGTFFDVEITRAAPHHLLGRSV